MARTASCASPFRGVGVQAMDVQRLILVMRGLALARGPRRAQSKTGNPATVVRDDRLFVGRNDPGLSPCAGLGQARSGGHIGRGIPRNPSSDHQVPAAPGSSVPYHSAEFFVA